MTEKSVASRLGAKLQKNSGRGQYAKGDARWSNFLVDFKEASKSFTLNLKVWGKACEDVTRVNPDLFPAINVILGEEGQKRTRLWIIDEGVLTELVEAWEAQNGLR